ncbi:hypothetical protein LWI29_021719 [Acer saccharum]|uniref:ENT domain-containing protein n=1 Tax=Acer saccharum TaxID=4024 RepID=A0AA39W3C2_ACESA|nr:hypothetical protein LWI29_021719 [Acer saccharum]
MNLQIHYLEKEAYSYVLRAFIAQSDLLTWGKEGLITELRKELNVTDTEHGELLGKINSDKSIKMIRDWRKGAHCAQESISETRVTQSTFFGTQAQKYVSRFQPVGTLPSTVPVPPTDDQHGGQLVMFSSGNPEQPLRVVNHSIQAPSDSKRKGLGKCHTKKGFLVPKVKKKSGVIEIRATDKLIHQGYGYLMKVSLHLGGELEHYDIERTIYGTKTPNPAQVEKAKLTLKEHERDILHALDKLADVSDGDEPPNQMQRYYPQKECPGKVQGTVAAQHNFYRQTGQWHGSCSEDFVQMHSVRPRVP